MSELKIKKAMIDAIFPNIAIDIKCAELIADKIYRAIRNPEILKMLIENPTPEPE